MPNQNLQRSEAAERSALITTHSYDVSLDVRSAPDPAQAGYTSRSTVAFSAAKPGASTFLDFIAGDVHSVVLNGVELPVPEVVDGARIRLDNLQAENKVTVTGTALYSSSGEGMHRFFDPADGQCYLYTQYEPADARRVFANFEQPDLKARFTFSVTAPAGWEVASNGAEAARLPLAEDAAAARWDFAATLPMSTYITSVLAGPYFKAEDRWSRTDDGGTRLDVPLALYCRASMAPSFDAAELFRLTKQGLEFFNGLFDYPYPWGKYDQAFVPEYNLGAMENPGLVTFTENYVFTSRAADSQYQGRANTLLHEMAHMWFGDLVTMQWWDDLWLKESFADYMGTLGVDRATDWETAWVNFANNRKAWAYVQDQLPTTHPIVADIPDLEAAKQNFDGITYAKGASVLKQLVAYVGFDAFIAGSRQYFREHEYGNTTLADLLGALADSSGRDLTTWARQWLQTSGISTLSAELVTAETADGTATPDDTATPDGGILERVTLLQDAADPATGRQEPRPHRLRIGLYNFDAAGMLVRTDSVETDLAAGSEQITALSGKPRPALLLVNDEDLSYAKVRLDPVSEATVRASLDRISDPMARALCWSALWNSARDGITPASQYVDAVLRFAAAESGIGVLLNVQGNATMALEQYVPATERDGLRKSFAEGAARELYAAEPGSDQQLSWARTLATVSRTEGSQAALLRRLLDGIERVPGLAVDAELRWSLWHALAALGLATEQELDAELARDTTASGRAGHATALAARPEAAVKAAAWDAAVRGTGLSNQLLSATIAGFNTASEELLDPYVEPYFECLEEVWAERSIEIASRIVRGLFPGVRDLGPDGNPEAHPVLARTDRWLAEHPDAPRALRRIIIEQRSHLRRSLAAQALSVTSPSAAPQLPL
ncbi:aminopeptidase N [Arthrobacter globiformis NBRC 12137]|uniref:Aminopeptidase N n=1 Tax=Arthrobacter globiformis (strain ATCC 8010 / DSM 20124 / JCM 1332 / NBRC 12137 / NCIMB 8907 / NRRL B-2979 / 168) TaxID=1077972 RepID=H0QN05_ARTG1|nr:aminopeptidase N [Arthrobacter globiformis]GAB14206.1 aminopeptidase N [Arthrobacter globiformis NBRC 12137]